MGHLVHQKDDVYRLLAQHSNKNPVGVPVNDTLMAILHRLYTETEAMVGSKFPLLPMTPDQINKPKEVGRSDKNTDKAEGVPGRIPKFQIWNNDDIEQSCTDSKHRIPDGGYSMNHLISPMAILYPSQNLIL